MIYISEHIDENRFAHAKRAVELAEIQTGEIGTLSEKNMHAVIKRYLEPDLSHHEVPIGRFFADLALTDEESGITQIAEIQTRNLFRLQVKLSHFLEYADVTLVYPMISCKYLSWIDPKTGEVISRRRSPKKGSLCDAFRELYGVRELLKFENITVHIIFADVEEYKKLDGYGKDKKCRATRLERVPQALTAAYILRKPGDYLKLLPPKLPANFGSNEVASLGKVSRADAQKGLRLLSVLGAIQIIEKKGNQMIYEIIK